MEKHYYDNLPSVADMLKKHGIEPKKSLGQNFLLDLNITDRFAKSVSNLEDAIVIEIGGGPGGITRSLLKNGAKKVIVIDLDRDIIPIQNELQKSYPNQLEIIHMDAMKVDYEALKKEYCKNDEKFIIASNLPFNISVHLLVKWLKLTHEKQLIDGMTLIFQKEVADRIKAPIKTKQYGRVSILAQLICKVQKQFNIGAGSFTPAPKVDTTVLQFIPNKKNNYFDFTTIEDIVRQAFNQRRKTIKSSLKNVHKNNENIIENWQEKGVKISARAEELTPENFMHLSTSLDKS